MIPVTGVCTLDQMRGDDEQDQHLLLRMAGQARTYLSSFAWCRAVKAQYFGDGYGGVVAVFFFHIEPARADVEEWLWVLVGDLPWAYIDIESTTLPSQVLERYVEGAIRWVEYAKSGNPDDPQAPLDLPRTMENAEKLETSVAFLKQHMIPAFQQSEILAS